VIQKHLQFKTHIKNKIKLKMKVSKPKAGSPAKIKTNPPTKAKGAAIWDTSYVEKFWRLPMVCKLLARYKRNPRKIKVSPATIRLSAASEV
jgi:hypothetical protein